MMLLGVLAMAYAAIVLFPETPAGRYLRSLLMEQPVAWLCKLNVARLIVQGGLLGVIITLLFAVRGSELFPLLAQALPEIVSYLIAIDAITALEVVVAIWLVTGNARVRAAADAARKAAWRWSVRCVSWSAARIRTARERAQRTPTRKPQIPNSDDDEHPVGAFAFA
jgi:hypothetical protein